MTGAGGDTGRGVRAAARGLRTWRKLLGMVLAAALVAAASAAAWKASRTTTAYQWYAVGMLALSETLIEAGLRPGRPKEIRHADGRSETVTLGAIANHPPLLALRERMIGDLLGAALIGLGIGAGIAGTALVVLHYAGGRLKRGRRLRGGELVSARQLRRRVAPLRIRLRRWFGRPYRIAGYLKLPGAWPVARIGLRYRKRPKVAERFAPRVEGETGAGRVEMLEDDWAEWPGETKAAVDLWESEPLAGAGVERDMAREERDRSAVSLSDLALSPSVSDANEENAEVVRTNPNAGRSKTLTEPLEATRPEPSFADDADADGRVAGGASRTKVDHDAGPDGDGRPPGAIANRADMRGRKSPDGAKPEGGMIPI